ncbi:acyl-CoA dehydrogenase [Exidia glandulosa HHB12029]|uniref:Acyl-CoA dehydrogenase n=1 Tax=Exidia glandulosa HHB12029 TaxID=1314781 RepID=A0A165MBV1_EXIGL|nr:acyl-CoA dehydrogenase [Exidia glandulosa HHB12029]
MTSPFYNSSHDALRAHVRQFIEREVLPHAQQWEDDGAVPPDVYRKFADAGLILPHIPAQYRDGRPHAASVSSWDAFHTMILVEELSRCPYTGVQWHLSSGTALGCNPIYVFGTDEQRAKFLPAASRGELRFCLGVTEPEGGSDVANLRTTATLSDDGTHYVVNGAKKWITHGLWADYMTTAVRTGAPSSGAKGLSFLLIPLKAPGVRRRRLRISGLHASGSTLVTLDNVRVPAENLLGKPGSGFAMIMANFNPERLALATNALALARICADDATAHTLRRKTFGKPLAENQTIRAKLASMERAIGSTHAWLEQLTYEVSTGQHAMQDPVVGAKLALLKVQAGKVLELCCREAQQIFGGLSMTKDGHGRHVEQISRDLRVFVVGGGSEEILDDLGIRILLSRARL